MTIEDIEIRHCAKCGAPYKPDRFETGICPICLEEEINTLADFAFFDDDQDD